jgi:hypothetical protein
MKRSYLALAAAAVVLLLGRSFVWQLPEAAGQHTEAGHGAQKTTDGHAAEKNGNEEYAGAADHKEEGGKELVRLSSEEQKEFGLVLAVAETGSLEQQISLPGEIALNNRPHGSCGAGGGRDSPRGAGRPW